MAARNLVDGLKLRWWHVPAGKQGLFFSLFGFVWRNNAILVVMQRQFLMFPEVKTNTVKNKYCTFLSKERTCVHYKWYWYKEVLISTISLVLISAVI